MEYLPLILSILIILIAIYYYIIKYPNIFKTHGILHNPPKPVVGNMRSVILGKINTTQFMDQLYNLHPEAKYVGFYEFTRPIILIRDADLIKSIGIKNFDAFQNHRQISDKKLDPLLANFLIFTVDDEWRNRRTMLTPMFTSNKLKSVFELMSKCAENFADYVSKLPESECEFEFKSMVTKYANDVIANCVYGVQVDSKTDPNNPFYMFGKENTLHGFKKTLKMIVYQISPWLSRALRLQLLRKEASDFFQNLTFSTVKARDEQGVHRLDFTQLLMETRSKREAGKGLSTKDISVFAFSFFFGGYDTVSTASCFTLHHLAVNPEIQKRLQDEIDRVIENTQGRVTYDAITKMEYLDAVVNEGLRMNPVFVILDRLCWKRFELPAALPGGKPFIMEPGMGLWIPVYSVHHDPNNYKDPEEFDPERFLADGKRIMNSGTYLPFGIGPRTCIGSRFALIKMKVLIFHLLARCTLKCSSKTRVPLELSKGLILVSSQHGFWLKVEQRKAP